jgi:hypothetical protein
MKIIKINNCYECPYSGNGSCTKVRVAHGCGLMSHSISKPNPKFPEPLPECPLEEYEERKDILIKIK